MIINSLIISAGLSKRMGEFKPLLFYNNKTFIVSIIEKLQKVSESILIVTGYKQGKLISEVKKNLVEDKSKNVKFIHNPEFECGMLSSLQKGIERAKNCDWLIYHFVDQPNIPDEFYKDFILQTDTEYHLIQPSYQNRNGHPVILNKSLFENIVDADKNSSLRQILNLAGIKKKIWECNYKEILEDYDTPDDYRKLNN